jgi:hypothetical protein
LRSEPVKAPHRRHISDAAHALDLDRPDRPVQLINDFRARGEARIVHRSAASAA